MEIVIFTQENDGIGPAHPKEKSHSWASRKLEAGGEGVKSSGSAEAVEGTWPSLPLPDPCPPPHDFPDSDFLNLSLASENTGASPIAQW